MTVARRLATVLVTALIIVLSTGYGAFATSAPLVAPSASSAAPDPNLGPATPGTTVCTVDHELLDEVTGMVATAQGIYAVEGGNTSDPGSVQIWTIDPTSCDATSENYGFDPADPQDLALAEDGALWIADTGDGVGDDNQRERVTMERVELNGSSAAVPYRTLYPDSGKITAPAVLLQTDDAPILIANRSGSAVLYRPDAALQAGSDSDLPKLVEVGTFTLAKTDTANPLGAFGNGLVTGAATSPDGTRVVIRTLSDAYEFKVGTDGDVVKAITDGTPVITRLPDEEDGQAITYSADGKKFLTLGYGESPVLRSYTPHIPQAPAANNAEPSTKGSGRLTFADITTIAAIVGFLGFLAVVAGVIGIYRSRRQFREQRERDGYDDGDEYGRPRSRGGRDRRDERDRSGVPGRDQRRLRSDRRGDGPPHGDDGFERVPRTRPQREDVWGPANPGEYRAGSRSGHGNADHEPRYGGGAGQGRPYGRVPAPSHSQPQHPPQQQPPPPPAPPPPPPAPPSGPSVGRARPRPASEGQIYGRPRPDPEGGNEPPRRGGYGQDNIDH